jgi:hypothetical protein
MVKLALPPLRVTGGNDVVSSEKITVPVGVPEAGAFTSTVAVKVTDCPTTLGFTEDVSVVVVDPLFTTWGTVPELVSKLGLPP